MKSRLTDSCWQDNDLKTLTMDVGFYISRFYSQRGGSDNWFGTDFDPGLTAEDWGRLLRDQTIFNENSLEIMKRMKDCGGEATCTQLSMKYGETVNFYNSGSVAIARRVCEATGIAPYVRKDGTTQWWSMLYTGRSSNKDEEGSFVWKLRDELSQALDGFDFSGVELYAVKADNEQERAYWWLNANPRIWSFSDIAIGEVVSYTLYNENGNKRRIFQNFLDAKAGDMFIGYESNPVKQVVAIGRISAGQDGEKIYFEKVRDLKIPIDYAALYDCPELEKMEYFQNPQGSLFKLTKDEYDFILDMISTEDSAPFGAAYQPFTKADFLKEVFMTEGEYDRLRALVLRNKNVILQGAPGVGKTFSAKRLAYSIIGEKNKSRVCMVQFHQNYSYEDFIMGYRPNDSGGFDLQTGVFYDFCEKCKESSEPYFFIIDEINRGNMSKIFGELLMLIENDKRGEEHKINLVYGGKPFYIPENLHIIGMMNTADRSLAMIDYALRRRFCFYTIRPAFEDAASNGFGEYTKNIECELYHKVIAKIKDLNNAIRADRALGKGFEIGHSYFAPVDTLVIDDEWVRGVVEFEIIPLIEEYWFDDEKRVKEWTDALRFALGESYDR